MILLLKMAILLGLVTPGQAVFFGQNAPSGGTPAGNVFTFVNSSQAAGSGTGVSVTLTSPVNGNFLRFAFAVNVASLTSLTVSDNGSSSYSASIASIDCSSISGWCFDEYYTCTIAGSPTTLSATWTAASEPVVGIVNQYSYTGSSAGCGKDAISTVKTGTCGSMTLLANAATSTSTNEVIGGLWFNGTATAGYTPENSFGNEQDVGASGASATLGTNDRIVSSTGSYQSGVQYGSSQACAAYTVAYK